ELKQMVGIDSAPKLLLNDHCQACEFRQRCQAQAKEEDNLTLLRGMTEKEVNSHARRGIFTVTQLSFTFRTRRKSKRAKSHGTPHHFALRARSIRDNIIHIHGNWSLPLKVTNAYFDIEGLPDRRIG